LLGGQAAGAAATAPAAALQGGSYPDQPDTWCIRPERGCDIFREKDKQKPVIWLMNG
jgi:hypothetical protein